MRHILAALINWAGVLEYDGTNPDLRNGRLDRLDGQHPTYPRGMRETRSHGAPAFLVSLDEYAEATR